MTNDLFMIGVGVICTTIGLVSIYFLANYKPKVLSPVELLKLEPGYYKNKASGSVIEVRCFNGKFAYAFDDTGAFNLRYDILLDNFEYLGSLNG